jgi:hypothetical protein
LPSRFRKDIVKAISKNDKTEVTPEDIMSFLDTIGKGQSISHEELVTSIGGAKTVKVEEFKRLM